MNLVNQIYVGANGRHSLVDFQEPVGNYQDIILFIHGFKGYKDWGAWNLVQDYFVSSGIAFCKFNMSHNGGTVDQPIDFPDLEAFAKNCYSYELEDVNHVLNWLSSKVDLSSKKIHLVGHSRGGGIAVLASSHPQVTSLITWASISNIEQRFPKGEELDQWRENGFYTVVNNRTKQKMKHYFSFYEDWSTNKHKLNIEEQAKSLSIPALHFHGEKDETVNLSESDSLSAWTGGSLIIISDANHTFNTFQPYNEEQMPNKLNEICNLTYQFISKI